MCAPSLIYASEDAGPQLRLHAMPPTRRHCVDPIRQALEEFEIDCDCKATLIVGCALDDPPECRERRHLQKTPLGPHEGTCGCKPRWLPSCLLRQPYGCDVCRDGKPCSCQRMYMPRCLLSGCAARKKGEQCQCPRKLLEECEHVKAKREQLKGLTVADAVEMGEAWGERMRGLVPFDPLGRDYFDRPAADAGYPAPAGPEAVLIMKTRVANGRSPWHPEDRRGVRGQIVRKQLQGLARLFLPEKGVGHGPA